MSNGFGLKNSNWKGGLPKCKDCGKQLSSYYATYCTKHSQIGSRSNNWKGQTPICKKCGKKLSRRSIGRKDRKVSGLCFACLMNGKTNPSWKGGKPKCVDCGKQLTTYGNNKRCKKCFHQYYNGKNSYQWKGGKPKCKVCGEKLAAYSAIYCAKHKFLLISGEKNYGWKGGKAYCLDCGKKLSGYDNKYCKRHAHEGNRSHLWQGGLTKLCQSIRNSAKNKEWIKTIFKRDDYTCQLCFKRGKKLHADHYPISFAQIFHRNQIKTRKQAMECEEFWNIDNGRTLCVPCHKTTDNYLKGAL